MTIKDVIEQERKDLQSVKRPYETVAFLIFAALFLQQLFYVVKNFINFLDKGTMVTFIGVNANLQGFVGRIINLDNNSWFIAVLGIVAWLFYYFVLYLFVWNYAKKHNLAKWTWTLFVAFGPTIFLAPAYIWFVLYAYRFYLVRFAKKVVSEFKNFDPETKFPEEESEPEDQPDPEKPGAESTEA